MTEKTAVDPIDSSLQRWHRVQVVAEPQTGLSVLMDKEGILVVQVFHPGADTSGRSVARIEPPSECIEITAKKKQGDNMPEYVGANGNSHNGLNGINSDGNQFSTSQSQPAPKALSDSTPCLILSITQDGDIQMHQMSKKDLAHLLNNSAGGNLAVRFLYRADTTVQFCSNASEFESLRLIRKGDPNAPAIGPILIVPMPLGVIVPKEEVQYVLDN